MSKASEFEIHENDYFRILWSPLLEALFVKDKSIHIICSESCNPSTAAKKKTTYSEAKNVIAFKIDVRIVCCCNGVNYELVNGESACNSGDDKIVQDEEKLTREGKDIQDCFVENQCNNLFPFMLQLVGPSIDISTLHLTAPGLYIGLPRYNVALPASIPELEEVVSDLLANLLTLRSYVLYMKETIFHRHREAIDTKTSLGKNNSSNNQKLSEISYCTRPTYYTPLRDAKTFLPDHLYGLRHASDLTEKLLKASFTTNLPTSEDICEFGWMKKNGRFYNLYAEEYSDKHICCDN